MAPRPITKKEIKAMQKILEKGMQKPKVVFDVWPNVQSVEPPRFPIDKGDQDWAGIVVTLKGAVFPKDRERFGKEEQPFFLVSSRVEQQQTAAMVGDPKLDAEPRAATRYNDGPVLVGLLGSGSHKVEVCAQGIDGTGGFREKVVKRFETLGGAVLGTSNIFNFAKGLPGVGDFATGLLSDIFNELIHGALATDRVGGDEVVLAPIKQPYKRKRTVKDWTGWKWVLFGDDSKELWYLTLWEINLVGTKKDMIRVLKDAFRAYNAILEWLKLTEGAADD